MKFSSPMIAISLLLSAASLSQAHAKDDVATKAGDLAGDAQATTEKSTHDLRKGARKATNNDSAMKDAGDELGKTKAELKNQKGKLKRHT